MRPVELHIFDFDGTLFHSPAAPEGHTGDSWWDDPQSLSPPCVPEAPGAQWYNAQVVSAFHKADANPLAVTCVMTGRLHYFHARVKALLNRAGIKPDELLLKPSDGGSTEAYKIANMRYLLKQLPMIQVIEFWEDRHHHLRSFQTAAERMGYSFVPHPVQARDQAACRVPDPERVASTWLQLSRSSSSET